MMSPLLTFINKLRGRLVATLLLIVFLAVLGMGITAVLTERAILYREAFTSLDSVSNTKIRELQSWLDERSSDTQYLALNRLNQRYLTEILSPETDSVQSDRLALSLRENLFSLKRAHPFYKRIDVANADGNIKVSTSQTATFIHRDTFINTIRNPNEIYIRDIFIDPESNSLCMQFSHALYAVDPFSYATTNDIIGLVVLTVDVEKSLFPILEDYQFLGETGEIVVGRNEGNETVILNNLRFAESDTSLAKRIPHDPFNPRPITLAARGKSGVDMMLDHYQNQTLIAYNALPKMNWGMVVKKDRSEILAPLWPLLQWLTLISLFLVVCAGLLAIRLWHRIAQPIRYLRTAIDSVASGDLAVDVQIMNNDEMGELAESFRDMLESLRRRRIDLYYATRAVEITEQENTQLVMQLRRLNSDLEDIVQDRTEELSVANNKLKELDELKSKFISNVSHELRNPVASLKLYVNLLNKSTNGNSQRYLGAIGRQIDILTHLVENVLDISHLETDSANIMLSPCDLKVVARRVIESSRPRAEAAGLELTLTLCPEPTIVLASASKLLQLISNLVSNAINYTEEGSVSLEIAAIANETIIIVKDTGIGIPQEDMPHLFERFYRGHNVNELEIQGTGLGLGIVKEVVDLHRGNIMVESEEGQGTRFQISIPLAENTYIQEEQLLIVDDVQPDATQ